MELEAAINDCSFTCAPFQCSLVLWNDMNNILKGARMLGIFPELWLQITVLVGAYHSVLCLPHFSWSISWSRY